MHLHYTKLDKHVAEMKAMAILLTPYSMPKIPADDPDISFLKQREVTVDGYTLVVHYSRADYGDLYLDIISLTGKHMPFLPMTVLCKVAERFLGKKELTFGEFLKNGRKLYSWMVLYKKDGTPINNNYILNGTVDSFNGLEFVRCDSSSVAHQAIAPPDMD